MLQIFGPGISKSFHYRPWTSHNPLECDDHCSSEQKIAESSLSIAGTPGGSVETISGESTYYVGTYPMDAPARQRKITSLEFVDYRMVEQRSI